MRSLVSLANAHWRTRGPSRGLSSLPIHPITDEDITTRVSGPQIKNGSLISGSAAEDAATIGRYCLDCARIQILILRRISEEEGGQRPGARPTHAAPELPEGNLEDLRQLIENLDETNSVIIADMVGAYQIQRSRMLSVLRDFSEPNRHGVENLTTENYVIDICSTSARHPPRQRPFSRAKRSGARAYLKARRPRLKSWPEPSSPIPPR